MNAVSASNQTLSPLSSASDRLPRFRTFRNPLSSLSSFPANPTCTRKPPGKELDQARWQRRAPHNSNLCGKYLSDRLKSPVMSTRVTYILLHPKRAKTVLHGTTRWRAPSPGRSPRACTKRSSVGWGLQWFEQDPAYHCPALRYCASSRRRNGGTEEGAVQGFILEGISLTKGGRAR